MLRLLMVITVLFLEHNFEKSLSKREEITYLFHGAGHYLKSWMSLSLSKNILSHGNRRFITVFTKARHWTLSWASWIQFAPSIP